VGKWITPPTLPTDKYCRQITIPNSPEWIGIVSGALLPMVYKNSWEQGELAISPDDASEAAFLMLQAFWESECLTDVPTPFWDDDTSVDDEATPEAQEWYGEVEDALAPADELTFVENAVIWLLTGFVLVAAAPTLGAAAAAAVFFRTTAVRFTLAFNRGDVAESIRVIVDAADYGEIDTSSMAVGDIVELDVNGLADSPSHDIYIITKPTP